MDIFETIKQRHSVRQYVSKKIEQEKRKLLLDEIKKINEENNLHLQIFFDEPKCFNSIMARMGKFSGVHNYIALVGKASSGLEEKCGYYGEKLVLLAQSLGLNTCWVAMTHGKSLATINSEERQVCIIALGYGKNQGVAHKSKSIGEVTECKGTVPDWFEMGMEAVLLAPTAMNQQKFKFTLHDENISAVSTGGICSDVNLGIVKYHFEAVTGRNVN